MNEIAQIDWNLISKYVAESERNVGGLLNVSHVLFNNYTETEEDSRVVEKNERASEKTSCLVTQSLGEGEARGSRNEIGS